jgi:hypothetical protein
MKVRTRQIVNDFLPCARHEPAVIAMEGDKTNGE